MAELRCSVDNCVHNKSEYCCKGDILVGGQRACCDDDTCCESFSESKNDRFTSSVGHPSSVISIDCEAVKCIHNSDYKCTADHVDIRGCGACSCRETACSTFQER
ncbi:MAG: DUF1540 domain-containing protein [Lachnospiraceae bacterium]|nr:DUF1540 domain-containing protein [Lachnospiraceae bacterium]